MRRSHHPVQFNAFRVGRLWNHEFRTAPIEDEGIREVVIATQHNLWCSNRSFGTHLERRNHAPIRGIQKVLEEHVNRTVRADWKWIGPEAALWWVNRLEAERRQVRFAVVVRHTLGVAIRQEPLFD